MTNKISVKILEWMVVEEKVLENLCSTFLCPKAQYL